MKKTILSIAVCFLGFASYCYSSQSTTVAVSSENSSGATNSRSDVPSSAIICLQVTLWQQALSLQIVRTCEKTALVQAISGCIYDANYSPEAKERVVNLMRITTQEDRNNALLEAASSRISPND